MSRAAGVPVQFGFQLQTEGVLNSILSTVLQVAPDDYLFEAGRIVAEMRGRDDVVLFARTAATVKVEVVFDEIKSLRYAHGDDRRAEVFVALQASREDF